MTQIEVTYIDHMGSDLSVVNAARVSFGKKAEWEYHDSQTMRLTERDTKLIKYLAKHKHISPFGHAFASFHIKAPIFVARQLVKHKFLRWNEISRRYVDDEPEFYTPRVWRGRSEDKKQGSSGEVYYHFDKYVVESTGERINHNTLCLDEYNDMLKAGVSPEQARMVLPQNTMTEWYWSGSLDAFTDMCSLRVKEDTQYESRLVAKKVYEELKKQFPVAAPLLVEGVY